MSTIPCPYCGHQVADQLKGTCPKCGGQYESERLEAERLRRISSEKSDPTTSCFMMVLIFGVIFFLLAWFSDGGGEGCMNCIGKKLEKRGAITTIQGELE